MFGRRKKIHKKVQEQKKKPMKVTHEGVTYHRDTRGDYRNNDGDILPTIILMSILSDSGNASAHDATSPDFVSGGGEFGGAGASGSFDSSSDSGSCDSGGGDGGGGGGGE